MRNANRGRDMWSVLWVVVVTVAGVTGDFQIVVTQGHTEATLGETSLNLTCDYEAAQMRFLQITPDTVTWNKIMGGQASPIFTVDLEAFRDYGHFEGSWMGRGMRLSPDGAYRMDIQLPANSLLETDAGEYQCVLVDTNNKRYANTTTVIVYHGPHPDNIHIHDDGTEFQVVEGQNLTLFCVATCNPSCHYMWYFKDQALISNDGVFYIDKTNRSDAGNYTCIASNSIGNATAVVEVEVFYGAGHHVWFNPPALHQNTTEGQTFKFACLAECHPACTLTWHKGDNPVPSQNGAVVLSSVNRTQTGVYTCHASNKVTNESRQLQITVNYGPENSVAIAPPSPTYVVREGGPVNVTCTATCYPQCTYVWKKDGMESYQSTSQVLYFQYVTRTQAGTYMCTVRNMVGSSEAVVKVDVQYKPSIKFITINFGDTTVNEGDKTTFTCQVDGNPTPHVTWMNMKTKTIVKQEDTSRESVYTIRAAKCEDAAVYRCSADNGIGSPAHSQIQLYVMCIPRGAGTANSSVLARSGSEVSLTVRVLAYPDPSFVWYQMHSYGSQVVKGPRFHVNSTQSSTTLIISDIALTDYGQYLMNATNKLGGYTEAIQLLRADPPNKPDSFYCTNHTDHSVQLQWVSMENNGAPQEFHLQYVSPGGTVMNSTEVVVSDPGKGLEVYADVTDLDPYTMYKFLLTSANKFGRSVTVLTTCFTTKEPDNNDITGSHTLSFLQGMGAGIGITIALIILGGVIVYYARKKYSKYRIYSVTELSPLLSTYYNDTPDSPVWRPNVDNKKSSAWNNRDKQNDRHDIPVTTLRPLLNGCPRSPDKNVWRDTKNQHL